MAKPATSAHPTRDQILDAAERLFADCGFAATTIKDLAVAAQVNSALLYYYFGDKERLYRAVLERVVRRTARRASARLEQPGTPEERLRAFVLAYAELLARDRHVWPLFLRELMDRAAAHAVEQVEGGAAALMRALAEVIAEGQRLGQFRRDMDPRFAAVSTVSLVAHFFTIRPVIGVLLGGSAASPSADTTQAYALHAANYALAALRVPPDAAPSKRR